MSSREEAMLGRLAELDLAAAEKAHARYMAAEDADDADRFGRTYQRLARSLRQTLALKAKLAREREIHRIRTTPAATPTFARGERLLTPAHGAHIDKAAAVALKYLERERETPDYDDIGEAEIYEVLTDLARDGEILDRSPEDLAQEVLDLLAWPHDDADEDPGPAPDTPPAAPTRRSSA